MPDAHQRLSFCRTCTAGLLAACLLHCQPTGAAHASEMRRTAIVKAVEQVKPSVVNIHGEKTIRPTEGIANEADGVRRVNGMGTGIVVDERGYILTNHHVVDGVQKIQVTLFDGASHVARLISFDPQTDLAVIKVEAGKPLTVVNIGTSSDLMTGEPVIAVGNAYGYGHTVTRGIISSLHRTVQVTDAQNYEDLIQTDASINPGNSGGPLLNIDGDMIGINVAVRAGAQGIGFAIPADKAMAVAADLLSTRRVDNWHGITARNDSSSPGGLVVGEVARQSPAERIDLQPGDVITRAGDRTVARGLDFERALLGRRPGEKIALRVRRQDQELDLELALVQAPSAAKPASDPTWEVFGLKLEPIAPHQFQQFQSRYRGGLAVKAVRTASPASAQGIRPGDVLVGMHVWETVTLDNVTYILNRPDFAELNPLKFYILRGNETRFGHLQASINARTER